MHGSGHVYFITAFFEIIHIKKKRNMLLGKTKQHSVKPKGLPCMLPTEAVQFGCLAGWVRPQPVGHRTSDLYSSATSPSRSNSGHNEDQC